MTDRLLIATRERPLSSDINNLEAMVTRTLADALRYMQTLRRLDESLESIRSVVLGGLVVTPAGSDITISPGCLLLDSASLSPTPGTYDSTYRIGMLRTAQTVAMPVPGADTFYLIEAQPVDVTLASVSRDILDPGTGQFVPTLIPKIVETRVQFQTITGTANAPSPSGGDWIPIAIVRRPSGGGAVLSTDIYDVRPLPQATLPSAPVRNARAIETAGATNNVKLRVDLDGFYGQRTFQTFTDIDPTSVAYLSPGTVLATGRVYLYLAAWAGGFQLTPRQSSGVRTCCGVLVLSNVAPSRDGSNSSSIALPEPFGISPAGAGAAYYVGTLIRTTSNVWAIMQATDGRVRLARDPMNAAPFALITISPTSGSVYPLTAVAPPTAKIIDFSQTFGGSSGTDVGVVEYRPTSSSTVLAASSVPYVHFTSADLAIPYNGAPSIDIRWNGPTPPGALPTLNIATLGWSE